jgi:PIN domain nuclease of toxin-antitoxin system
LPNPVVLDSSAILAVFLNEPGGEIVLPLLAGALFSTVNLAEAHMRLIEVGASAGHAWSRLHSIDCEICFFSDTQARAAAELRSLTRPFGLSLGDRACLALALERKATVYTADKVWKNLDLGIDIVVIR